MTATATRQHSPQQYAAYKKDKLYIGYVFDQNVSWFYLFDPRTREEVPVQRKALLRVTGINPDGTPIFANEPPSLPEVKKQVSFWKATIAAGMQEARQDAVSYLLSAADDYYSDASDAAVSTASGGRLLLLPPAQQQPQPLSPLPAAKEPQRILSAGAVSLLTPPVGAAADGPWAPDAPFLVLLDTGGAHSKSEKPINQISFVIVRRLRGGGYAEVPKGRFEWDGRHAAAAGQDAWERSAGDASRRLCALLEAAAGPAGRVLLLAHNGHKYDFPRLESLLRASGCALPECVVGSGECTRELFAVGLEGRRPAGDRKWSLGYLFGLHFPGERHGKEEKRGQAAKADVRAMMKLFFQGVLRSEGGAEAVEELERTWLANATAQQQKEAAPKLAAAPQSLMLLPAPTSSPPAAAPAPAASFAPVTAFRGMPGLAEYAVALLPSKMEKQAAPAEAAASAHELTGICGIIVGASKKGGWVTLQITRAPGLAAPSSSAAPPRSMKVRYSALRRVQPAAGAGGAYCSEEISLFPPTREEVLAQVVYAEIGASSRLPQLPGAPASSLHLGAAPVSGKTEQKGGKKAAKRISGRRLRDKSAALPAPAAPAGSAASL